MEKKKCNKNYAPTPNSIRFSWHWQTNEFRIISNIYSNIIPTTQLLCPSPPRATYSSDFLLKVLIMASAHSHGRSKPPGSELKYSQPTTPPKRG